MAGEEWQHKRKKQKASVTLANWCDANLPLKTATRVALLVSKNEASPRLVGILKTHRARNEVLDKAQRIALEAEVKGAGSWTATIATTPTGGSTTPRPTRRAAFSDDAKNSSRPSYASVAAGAKDPQLLATQRKLDAALKKTKDMEEEIKHSRAAAAALGGTAAAAVDEEMSSQEARLWHCESCGARHRKLMRSCRICATRRVTTVPAGPAAPHTPEETEAECAKLSAQLVLIRSWGTDEWVANAVSGLQARMVQLKAQPAAAAVKTARQSYEQAQEALDELENRQVALAEKSGILVERIDELGRDLEAAGKALDLVKEEVAAASALRDAALLALGTPTADTVAAATTAPSAAAAAAAAISEYKAKICGLLTGTTLLNLNEAYLKYKETDAVGVAHMGELEFFVSTLMQSVEAQADVSLARNQAPQGGPASPASAEAAVAQVPDSAGTPTAVAGAAPRGSGDGQLGQRPSFKTSFIEADKAKIEIERHRATIQQRNAARGENFTARRAEDL